MLVILLLITVAQGMLLSCCAHGSDSTGLTHSFAETGIARPPLPPAARPSRLAPGSAPLHITPLVAAAAAAGGPVTPSSPFAGPAATMVAPGAADSTPPVAQTAARRQLTVASSSTDLQHQGQQAEQQHEEVRQHHHDHHQHHNQQVHDQHRQGSDAGNNDEDDDGDDSTPKSSSGVEAGTAAEDGDPADGLTSFRSRSGSRSGSPTPPQQRNGGSSTSDQQSFGDGHNEQHADPGKHPEKRQHPTTDNTRSGGLGVINSNATAGAQQITAVAVDDADVVQISSDDNETSQDEEFVDASDAATADSSEGQQQAGDDDMQE